MKRMRRNFFTHASGASRNAVFVAATLFLSCGFAWSQVTGGSSLAPLPSAESVINRNTDNFAGSIPQGKATNEIIELTIDDALDRGLKYNLGLYLSDQTTAEARAARLQSLSALLPNVSGTFGEELQRLNLKSFGFKFTGFPSSVGPFGLTATQATGSWNLLDLAAIDKYRASGETVKAAQFNYRDARDTVVLTVGANYLLVIAQESRLEAAQAQLKTAQALYQLASDQETAGLAPNIDTLRARVQLQAQQEADQDLELADAGAEQSGRRAAGEGAPHPALGDQRVAAQRVHLTDRSRSAEAVAQRLLAVDDFGGVAQTGQQRSP